MVLKYVKNFLKLFSRRAQVYLRTFKLESYLLLFMLLTTPSNNVTDGNGINESHC